MYYVYAYLREDRYSPYYIGKGKGYRLIKQEGRKATVPRDRTRIVKIAENLSNEEALELEKKLILFWGRKCDGGILLNEQEGGTEPPRKKVGGRGGFPIGKPSWMSGRKQKPEWVAKRSHQVVIDGVEYYSKHEAARQLGMSVQVFCWRMKRWGNPHSAPTK